MIISDELERAALTLWQARELRLPGPGRRIEPDRWDEISGAWGLCLAEAKRELDRREDS